jgi:hypothetical protein
MNRSKDVEKPQKKYGVPTAVDNGFYKRFGKPKPGGGIEQAPYLEGYKPRSHKNYQ